MLDKYKFAFYVLLSKPCIVYSCHVLNKSEAYFECYECLITLNNLSFQRHRNAEEDDMNELTDDIPVAKIDLQVPLHVPGK
jgi:hypothetical protein